MKRLLAAVTALLVLMLGSACTGTADVDDVDALRSKAATLTDLLAKNDWKAVRRDFDATMSDKLTEAGLESAWGQVTQLVGAYQSRSDPTEVAKPGDSTVFDTPMQFERGAMKSRVTFRSDGRISGLFILRPNVP